MTPLQGPPVGSISLKELPIMIPLLRPETSQIQAALNAHMSSKCLVGD